MPENLQEPSSSGEFDTGLQTSERRNWVRYTTDVQVTWTAIGSREKEVCLGRVQDLSVRGIGLLLPRSYSPGALLHVHWPQPNGVPRSFLVRVLRVTPTNGSFEIGCTFAVPLKPTELAGML